MARDETLGRCAFIRRGLLEIETPCRCVRWTGIYALQFDWKPLRRSVSESKKSAFIGVYRRPIHRVQF